MIEKELDYDTKNEDNVEKRIVYESINNENNIVYVSYLKLV